MKASSSVTDGVKLGRMTSGLGTIHSMGGVIYEIPEQAEFPRIAFPDLNNFLSFRYPDSEPQPEEPDLRNCGLCINGFPGTGVPEEGLKNVCKPV